MSLYQERDIDDLEPFYSEHVHAMTGEGLHKKSAIAAELAYRDKRIAELEAEIKRFNKLPPHGSCFYCGEQHGNLPCPKMKVMCHPNRR